MFGWLSQKLGGDGRARALVQRLSHLAEQTGRSKTFYMLEAIKQHLDDLEDVYLAERELEAVRAGKSKAVPLEDVMKQYGLAD